MSFVLALSVKRKKRRKLMDSIAGLLQVRSLALWRITAKFISSLNGVFAHFHFLFLFARLNCRKLKKSYKIPLNPKIPDIFLGVLHFLRAGGMNIFGGYEKFSKN